MPKGLEAAIVTEIVKRSLMGMSSRQIAKEVTRKIGNVSPGSVTNKVREFEKAAEETGTGAAAEAFGMSETVEGLRMVGRFVRKNNLDLQEMAEGGKLAVALQELKIPVGEVRKYVLPVYTKLRDAGFDAGEVASQIQELNDLEKKHGPFEKLRSDLQKTANDLKEAAVALEARRTEIDDATRELGRLRREYGVSREEAKAYSDTKSQLLSLGLDMDDVSSAEKCLGNLKERKFNARRVVAAFKELESLNREIASRKGERTSVTEQVAREKRELDRVGQELGRKRGQLDEAKLLAKTGLEVGAVREIRTAIESRARKRKIPATKAMREFKEDVLDNYDPILGMKADLGRLTDEKAKIEEELSEMAGLMKGQDALYNARKDELEALQSLEEKGVDGDILLEWEETLSESGLDARSVSTELRTYKNLKQSLKEAKSQKKEAEKERETLSEEVNTLGERRNQLEASIKEVTKTGLESLQAHLDTFRNSLEEIERETLKGAGETSEMIKTNVGALAQSVKETATLVDGELDSMYKKVEGITEKALQTGQEIQKVRALKPLVNFYERGEGTKADVLTLSARYVANLERWASDNGLGRVQSAASSLGAAMHDAFQGP